MHRGYFLENEEIDLIYNGYHYWKLTTNISDFCTAIRNVVIAETFPRKITFESFSLYVVPFKSNSNFKRTTFRRDFKTKQIRGRSVFTIHYFILYIERERKSAKFSWNTIDHCKLV